MLCSLLVTAAPFQRGGAPAGDCLCVCLMMSARRPRAQAASPDEAALVVAAKALGVFFCRRTLDAVFVREAPPGLPAAAAADAPEQRYQARARPAHGQGGGGAWA